MSEALPTGACCAPSRPAGGVSPPDVATETGQASAMSVSTDGMATIEGGSFLMGTDDEDGFPADGEGPIREVGLPSFLIDTCSVSNTRFGAFVDATGYLTDAERYGWSFVFGGLLPDDFPATRGVTHAPWWRQVFGADWQHPEGPQSGLSERHDHPVVHVSWRDACSFCAWSGMRLPTEAEWEYAARGGLVQERFPWGGEREPDGEHRMNIWQGMFPSANTLADGYLGTCPVDSFPANGFGLHNTSGNVWEWCSDWFAINHPDDPVDPSGPPEGQAKVTRGGSYLCHDSYCNRYRVAARSSNTPDTSTGNTGFRCARDPEPRDVN